MPVYSVRLDGGRMLKINTTAGFTVHRPSGRVVGAVVEIGTFGRPDALTALQASDVAEQDFRARTARSCASCYFHGRRQDKGACDRLCCAIREVALEQGVEISPYVHKAEPAIVAPDPVPYWLPARLLGWCALLIFWRNNIVGLAGSLIALFSLSILLLLAANWQAKESL